MLGILGGTFDPVHYGHLRPAREARERLGLAAVRFVPAARPPHREPPVASFAQRLHMIELALDGESGFLADGREARRAGPSYTVDTLTELRTELPRTPLCLLLGADAFLGLESWHRWREIPELAHLIVLQRPGWDVGTESDMPGWARPRVSGEAGPLADAPAGLIHFLAVQPQDISATALRRAFARGEDAAGLLPAAVIDYIRQEHLYTSE